MIHDGIELQMMYTFVFDVKHCRRISIFQFDFRRLSRFLVYQATVKRIFILFSLVVRYKQAGNFSEALQRMLFLLGTSLTLHLFAGQN